MGRRGEIVDELTRNEIDEFSAEALVKANAAISALSKAVKYYQTYTDILEKENVELKENQKVKEKTHV
jgi:hypothetical protein